MGKDRSSIANYVRLLRLPQEVRANVASNTLSMGHARALLALTDENAQLRLARDIVARSLSVRETEALVKKAGGAGRREAREDRSTSTRAPRKKNCASPSARARASCAKAKAAASRSIS